MADEKMWKLAEGQKVCYPFSAWPTLRRQQFIMILIIDMTLNIKWQRDKEKLHKKIIELEKKLDAKQALELEIVRMRGAVQVMKHVSEDGNLEDKRKMETIEKDLKDKEEDLEQMEALNQALIVKERQSNDELQEARKELINVLSLSLSYVL